MAKAIDNIKAWAKENVQLITILPENKNLQVDTRLKDVLETSVDEKYYLSDEKTGALLAELEKKDKVTGTVGHHPFSKKFEFSGYNSEVSPTLLATDYKAPKTVLEDAAGIYTNTSAAFLRKPMPGLSRTLKATKQKGILMNRNEINRETDIENCLMARDYKGFGNQDMTGVLEENNTPSEIAVPVLTPDRANKRQNGRRFKEDGEPSFTLTAQDKHGVAILRPVRTQYGKEIRRLYENGEINESRHNMTRLEPKDDGISNTITTVQKDNLLLEKKVLRIRKLTPRECFRLQSFPDRAFDKAAEVNSNSQLYRQAGNSVTVNVIHEIAKRL